MSGALPGAFSRGIGSIKSAATANGISPIKSQSLPAVFPSTRCACHSNEGLGVKNEGAEGQELRAIEGEDTLGAALAI